MMNERKTMLVFYSSFIIHHSSFSLRGLVMVSNERYTELAELAGGFLHDIKNHISNLTLHLDLLAEDLQAGETPREKRALTKVQKLRTECERLIDISNDFLRYARISDLEREPCDLTDVVEE